MTEAEFYKILTAYGIDRNLVSINVPVKDGYCIRKTRLSWETFTRERGKEYNAVGFSSESDALMYLLGQLYKIYIVPAENEKRLDELPDNVQ